MDDRELDARAYAERRAPIRVAVIDSGWDRSIADDRVQPGISFVGKARPFDAVRSMDDRDSLGHGTSCIDLLLREAPRVLVIPVRVFDYRLETSPRVIIAALEWAVDTRVDLINLSLGTERADVMVPLYRACARAREAGVVIVAAAREGRSGSYPAVFEPVLGVGDAPLSDLGAIRYSADEAIECRVRSRGRRARGLGGRMVTVSGTSFAAPVVTGRVAGLLEGERGLGLDGVRRRLATKYGDPLHPM